MSIGVCLIIGDMPNDERFFRQTRRFDAEILCVFQGKSTQYDGKRSVIWAYCPFVKQTLSIPTSADVGTGRCPVTLSPFEKGERKLCVLSHAVCLLIYAIIVLYITHKQ